MARWGRGEALCGAPLKEESKAMPVVRVLEGVAELWICYSLTEEETP